MPRKEKKRADIYDVYFQTRLQQYITRTYTDECIIFLLYLFCTKLQNVESPSTTTWLLYVRIRCTSIFHAYITVWHRTGRIWRAWQLLLPLERLEESNAVEIFQKVVAREEVLRIDRKRSSTPPQKLPNYTEK